MKKILYIAFAFLLLAACGKKDNTPTREHPALVKANYTNLTRGEILGEELHKLPVTATENGTVLTLDFFTDKIYLPAGTFTFGEEAGQYTGHFKNDFLDNDIVGGMLTIGLEGESSYSISGTVRMNDADRTAVKIRATGDMVYEYPTEHYYTVEKGTVAGFNATIFKVYDLDNVQMAEAAVIGEGNGPFVVTNTGEAGTALYGQANAGTWFYDKTNGTNVMLHGSVSMNYSHDKCHFYFTDALFSGEFINCEKVESITPAPMAGVDNAYYTLKAKMFSIESPLVEGMYELTVKFFFPDGREFQTMTLICPSPNPAVEKPGSGNSFILQGYDAYLEATGNQGIAPACFYRIGGIKIAPDPTQIWAAVLNYQKTEKMEAILAIFLNAMTYGPPEDALALMYGDMYGFMGFL